MADWRKEYLASILERQWSSVVNEELVQACTLLVDRYTVLQAENAVLAGRKAAVAGGLSPLTRSGGLDEPLAAHSRLDLVEALRSRDSAQTRLKVAEDELGRLRARAAGDARAVREATTDRHVLTTKVKDREHELREKRKLIENVQDEMITLNLQLSMVETERDKIKKENKDLVDRLMQWKASEADVMNARNEPIIKRG